MHRLVWAVGLAAAVGAGAAEEPGFKPLFDGKTTAGWRGFKSETFPLERWAVVDGCLKQSGRGNPHKDIVTEQAFGNFDFRFEWKVAEGGNSGVKYLVTEERSGPVAHEYQVLDNEKHPDGKVGRHRWTASFYDVLPPAENTPSKPAGEWNESRILVKGNHVEHWLNGSKVLEYELGSPELKAAIANSKFKDVAGFGTKIDGRILLQDHGDEVWYRNLRIQAPPK